MSLMLKLSAIALLGSSLLAANNSEVETFLKKQIGANPSIKALDVKVVDKKVLKSPKGWDAMIVNIKATVKQGKNDRKLSQRMVYFVNGDYLTSDLTNMKTGERLKNSISPEFKAEFYKKSNLIYGNENAEHKIAIFSDPLCPFCKRYVPTALKYMKAHPKKFAVYFYHLPLKHIHPSSPILVKASIYAELMGKKDVVSKLYSLNADYKISKKDALKEFNKVLKMNITKKDLNSPEVLKIYKESEKISDEMMVRGTPTVFFDGKVDKTKKKYEKAK